MATALLKWYATIGAKYLDLVGDYAGKEKFFVEGDSLLLQCFSDPLLDFDPGFQLLHAVYLVEKHLHSLLKRGCNFDIVFFDNHTTTCIPSFVKPSNQSRYILARSLIIKHFQQSATNTTSSVHCFESLNDPAFGEYLYESACYFALCADGAVYKRKGKSLLLESHSVSNGTGSDQTRESNINLRSVIYTLLHEKGLDVALLNGLTLQDSKVFAFVLQRSERHAGLDVTLPQKPLPILDHDQSNDDGLARILEQTQKILSETHVQSSARMMVTAAALYKSPTLYQDFIRPLLVGTILLQSTKIADRRLPSITFENEEVFDEFLGYFCQQATYYVNSSLPIAYDSTLVDLIDGRLFRNVLASPSKYESSMSSQQLKSIKALMQILCPSDSQPNNLRLSSRGILSSTADQTVGAVLPFNHPAFDKHLECINVQVDGSAEDYGGKLALELTHWHNTKKLGHSRRMASEQKNKPPWLVAKEKGKELRSYQRFIARQTSYAISLSGTITLDPRLILVDKAEKGSKKKTASKVSTRQKVIQQPARKGAAAPRGATQSNQIVNGKLETIDETALLARLTNEGPHFDRSMDARQDSRVSFNPDAWQVKVLDELDEGNSLLVVAPTSAGKTFVSFYAMEKVLRGGDDGVIVYVAPTKALVNQIAAEVQAKFRKPSLGAGRTLWSIFTRDYRVHEPTKAQILVTVPHMLQIMLMSASNKNWVPRIKSIIFDEVHSVTNAEDGLVWEQLLMAAPCQIIALSATIGNTADFARWMAASQEKLGRTCTLVQHDHRYSDLRKYTFDSQTTSLKGGLPPIARDASIIGLEDVHTMEQIHPAACLLHRHRGFPDDLALESADCLRLWQWMTKHQTAEFSVPDELSPRSFFKSSTIVKADILNWGARLKIVLATWMESPTSPFDTVLREVKKNLEVKPKKEGASSEIQSDEEKGLLETTMPLLCDLRENNALPAIFFNYNRGACEEIAQTILKSLVEAETQYKADSVTFQKKMERYEYWKKTAATRDKQKKAGKKSKNAVDPDEVGGAFQARAATEDREEAWDNFDPEAPLDKFSFADIKKNDQAMINDLFRQLRWAKVPDYLFLCFQRGIGVHHSGLNKWYRQAVEMFFRKGYLTVVVATGTLSLGINMPCKTVVFSGDSVFLTALNYRQASGRAGRRGFDLLGNVVFQNIPTNKVLRLMSSRLPDINGHFPMTTVFVLRLLALLQGTDNAPYAMTMVDSLLSQPRLFLAGEEFKQQVLHHIRFSIEYLRSQGLINGAGNPVGFANCVSHLYYVENNALAFHALLKEGYFHWLAFSYASNKEQTLKKLMIALAHLFGRHVMRSSEADAETIRKSVSRVFLPDLPDEAAKILKAHNQQTLNTYKTYVSTFVDQHCKEEDITLPFTGTSIVSDGITKNMSTSSPAPKMRSPFVALSGHGDNFDSVAELCESVRGGVFLEKAVIPYLDMADEMDTPLNAYLYDFYISGSVKALHEANKIPKGDIWFVLKDFTLVMATIITSFENFLSGDDTTDADLVQGEMSDDDRLDTPEESEKGSVPPSSTMSSVDGSGRYTSSATTMSSEGRLPYQSSIATDATSTTSTSLNVSSNGLPVRKKKAKVADSWDDESDGEESDVAEVVPDDAVSMEGADGKHKAERELRKVCNMFKDLQQEFEEMFRKTWA